MKRREPETTNINDIIELIKEKDIAQITKLLSETPDLITQEKDDLKLIHHLAKEDFATALVLGLIDKDKNLLEVQTTTQARSKIVHVAAKEGNLQLVQALIDKYNQLNNLDKAGNTALGYAAAFGKIEVMKGLLKTGLVVANNNGATALHVAAAFGQNEAAKWLLEQKDGNDKLLFDINTPDKAGRTALHSAAQSGKIEVMKELLKTGLVVANNKGATALHYAAANGHTEIVKWLLEQKDENGKLLFDINTPDNVGNTVLHYAAVFGRVDLVKWFLEQKDGNDKLLFDVNTPDNAGKTALSYAAELGRVENGQKKIAKLLIKHGAGYYQRRQWPFLITPCCV